MQPDVKLLFLLCITTSICVRADDFVYQYYVNEGVTRVTVFSCDQTESNTFICFHFFSTRSVSCFVSFTISSTTLHYSITFLFKTS